MTKTYGSGRNSELVGKELSLTGPAKNVTDFLDQLLASSNIKHDQIITVNIYRHTTHLGDCE